MNEVQHPGFDKSEKYETFTTTNGLKEAAENRVTENGRFKITSFEKMRIEDILFGAEWMAKQGVCIPAHIFMPCEIKDVYDSSKGEYPAAIHPDCGGSLVLERYLKDFKHNEEVIMQIRKKEE